MEVVRLWKNAMWGIWKAACSHPVAFGFSQAYNHSKTGDMLKLLGGTENRKQDTEQKKKRDVITGDK